MNRRSVPGFASSAVVVATLSVLVTLFACGHDQRPTPLPVAPVEAGPTPTVEPPEPPPEREAVRVSLGRGTELYLPPWFAPKRGGYDLVVHFHGESRWQEANVAHDKLDAAVVSVNLGVGTEPYAKAFQSGAAFDQLLANTHAAIVKSGRDEGARVRRIALSAWSAGFSSVARVLTDAVAERVDAVLLADGFFTFFTDPKKRIVHAAGIEKFARFASAARQDRKLFVITHTTIPTGPYPSAQECVAKLLEMTALPKTEAVKTGPRDLHQLYTVDDGSFHVRGFEGTQASDHVKQLHVMGEIAYPLLARRWAAEETASGPSANGPR